MDDREINKEYDINDSTIIEKEDQQKGIYGIPDSVEREMFDFIEKEDSKSYDEVTHSRTR